MIDVCRQAPYGYDQRAEVLGLKGMVATVRHRHKGERGEGREGNIERRGKRRGEEERGKGNRGRERERGRRVLGT
jgi:hypothetical protein